MDSLADLISFYVGWYLAPAKAISFRLLMLFTTVLSLALVAPYSLYWLAWSSFVSNSIHMSEL